MDYIFTYIVLLFEVICLKFHLIQPKSSDFKAQMDIYLYFT